VVEPIDMRAGIDGLSQRIQDSLGRTPCDGNAYAFRNRRQNRLKLLIWDGTGVWLCQRRLHRGHFIWPSADTPVCTLTAAQWQWLIAGVDWQRLSASHRRRTGRYNPHSGELDLPERNAAIPVPTRVQAGFIG
jgi:transposase